MKLALLLFADPAANPEQAFQLLQQAEDNAEAQYELGRCYQTGKGTAINDKAAHLYYKKSANGGSMNGQPTGAE